MSIRSSVPQFEKKKVARFRCLDTEHISAIESLYQSYPFLKERVEIHMPFHRAKPTFSSGTVWLWPKFDKRPVGYLIFLDGFAPCIWYPDRQEGMTFRWLLPPSFCHAGPTICFANILAGESLLQIEDLIIYQGRDLWSHHVFSERWKLLLEFWGSLPPDQPLLAFQPRLVQPIALENWAEHYQPQMYWIIQADHMRQPRWYWKDTITPPPKQVEYHAPKMKRDAEMVYQLCAACVPCTHLALPDTYSLLSQEGQNIGIACISTLTLSLELRQQFEGGMIQVTVEVKWNEAFRKYQIVRIMSKDTPLTTASFFNQA
jgi:hypothetical protein